MLKKIGLKNVRSFKDLKDLEIKPITILCGTNSSGKSTILKSLLLWKQTLENLTYTDGFLLNGRYTNLGTQENLLNNNAKNKLIRFNFQFELGIENINWEDNSRFVHSALGISNDQPGFNSSFIDLVRRTIPKKILSSSDWGGSIKLDFTLGYKINAKSRMGIDIKEYNVKIIPIEGLKDKFDAYLKESNQITKSGMPEKFQPPYEIQYSNNVELKISLKKLSFAKNEAIDLKFSLFSRITAR